MKDLEKVSANQLFNYWKNFSIGLSVLFATLLFSKIFPFYFSPIIGLVGAAVLYTQLYNDRLKNSGSCMLISYALFYCIILYSFTEIVLNVLDIWGYIAIPKEISFFNKPFIPGLVLDPVCFVVLSILYLRRHKLKICLECKLSRGLSIERGKLGGILSSESNLQLRTLIVVFGLLTIIVWTYYRIWYYDNALVNNRDWYVFSWLNVIAIIFVEIYVTSRYYNIYLDLKDNGDIISEEELSDMSAKLYLRVYVICGNKVFLNPRVADSRTPGRFITDTPFVTKRNVNGITISEVNSIIRRLTDIDNGELRFFYGRNSLDIKKHRLMRYFYFINCDEDQLPELNVDGQWVDFQAVKHIYTEHPDMMSTTLLTDISRMSTIILTQKLFDDHGYRKMKIKTYQPSFDLKEVREKNYDFQDDKWIRISMYNSDVRSFHIKRWWNKFIGRNKSEDKKWGQSQ